MKNVENQLKNRVTDQFFSKLIFLIAKNCVNCTRQHYDVINQVEKCKRKRKEAFFEGLKFLNKELFFACSNELKLL